MKNANEKYMRMALRLAQRGLGAVEPNPMVGCVITKANQIIGKGWHKRFGQAHAEIAAMEDCKNLGIAPDGATMYVTLEPCCHHGKTGPCTDAIIQAGPAKVVVATVDPSPHAAGRGIAQLREAGIQVEVGVCETEARLLNAPFMKYGATGRCWTILKWAQSIDSRMAWATKQGAAADSGRQWISNELSRKDVQVLRRRVGAILVGIETVLADDPLLTPRPPRGRKPLRIVLDSYLRIPLGCRLLRTLKTSPTLVYASQVAIDKDPKKAERIRSKGAEVVGYSDQGRSNLHYLIDRLSERGISQLLVEGGPTVLTSFLQERLVDEITVYVAPRILGAEGGVDTTSAMASLNRVAEFRHMDVALFDTDVRFTGLSVAAFEQVLNAGKSGGVSDRGVSS